MILPKTYQVTDYLGHRFECTCGRSHTTALEDVKIGKNAISEIPQLLEKHHAHYPMIVCDRNTKTAAGELVIEQLRSHNVEYKLHLLDREEVIPDEQTLGELLMAHTPNMDMIIAVGTGTINDLCKYLSFHLSLPYLVVATAPSMDGFASIGAALITDHLKTTYDTHVPVAIVGDTTVLKNSPMEMITAGLADILGKYTCLTDWKLAHIITDEYYCESITEMVQASIKKVVDNSEKVLARDDEAIEAIMEALVLSGIAMSFVGNSRPASGSEHHISHYWEMKFLFEGRKPVLHGTKVGIGTVISCELYQLLQKTNPDFGAAKAFAAKFDYDLWKKYMQETFLQAAPGVIALESKTNKNSIGGHITRIASIEHNWNEIIKTVQECVPTSENMISLLEKLHAPAFPSQVGVDEKMVVDGIIVAKEVRDRYTVLQLLWDLGLLEEYATTTAKNLSVNMLKFYSEVMV